MLVPFVVLLAYHTPGIGGESGSVSLSFGFLAQILLGVCMARWFGRQGLLAFTAGCVVVSAPVSGHWGVLGNAATDNLVAVLAAWLAADNDRTPLDSVLDRVGMVRRWAVFWPLLFLGLLSLSVAFAEIAAETAVRLHLWLDGLTVLAFLVLMLGLAESGPRLFTALLLLFAVALVADFVHEVACREEALPAWSCDELINVWGESYSFVFDLSMGAARVLPLLGGFFAAYGLGRYVRRLRSGEDEDRMPLRSPAKLGLVLLVLGVGFGRYSAIPLFDLQHLAFAGSYAMMLAGAFLLGSRLGPGGVAFAAVIYALTVQVPALVEWRPGSEPFYFQLSTGGLLDCTLAAMIGLGVRDRRRTPIRAPRRFETATIFVAAWALVAGMADLKSAVGWLWLMAAAFASALIVLAVRFKEERARAAGLAVTQVTDVLIVIALFVFLKEHVPGIVDALRDVGRSYRSLTGGVEITGLEMMLIKARNVPVQTWLFVLLLLLLVDLSVLYRRICGAVRELQALVRRLAQQRKIGGAGAKEPDPSHPTGRSSAGQDGG